MQGSNGGNRRIVTAQKVAGLVSAFAGIIPLVLVRGDCPVML